MAIHEYNIAAAKKFLAEKIDYMDSLKWLWEFVESNKLSVTSPLSPVHRHGGNSPGWGTSGQWGCCSWQHPNGKRHFGFGDTMEEAIIRCAVSMVASPGEAREISCTPRL